MIRVAITSLLLAGGLAALISVAPAVAQDGDAEAGAAAWRTGPCKDCHGWAGDGQPDVSQFNGANLRTTALGPEDVTEVIRCGIPGTEMPSWRNNAWTEIIPCFGMTEPLDQGQPNKGGRTLGDRTINNLVAFIFRDFVGQETVTREYCEQINGADSTRCPPYPSEAEVMAAQTAEAEAPAPAGDPDHGAR
ncbi:MAG TPA: c-type cytochrome [Devosiaceae bacterium]|nr:c-type cytochrome [Devosiaceae bacterium]